MRLVSWQCFTATNSTTNFTNQLPTPSKRMMLTLANISSFKKLPILDVIVEESSSPASSSSEVRTEPTASASSTSTPRPVRKTSSAPEVVVADPEPLPSLLEKMGGLFTCSSSSATQIPSLLTGMNGYFDDSSDSSSDPTVPPNTATSSTSSYLLTPSDRQNRDIFTSSADPTITAQSSLQCMCFDCWRVGQARIVEESAAATSSASSTASSPMQISPTPTSPNSRTFSIRVGPKPLTSSESSSSSESSRRRRQLQILRRKVAIQRDIISRMIELQRVTDELASLGLDDEEMA